MAACPGSPPRPSTTTTALGGDGEGMVLGQETPARSPVSGKQRVRASQQLLLKGTTLERTVLCQNLSGMRDGSWKASAWLRVPVGWGRWGGAGVSRRGFADWRNCGGAAWPRCGATWELKGTRVPNGAPEGGGGAVLSCLPPRMPAPGWCGGGAALSCLPPRMPAPPGDASPRLVRRF